MSSKKYIYILIAVIIIIAAGLVFYSYQKDGGLSFTESIGNIIKNSGEDKNIASPENGEIELKISTDGFNPDKFRVKRNTLINVSLINEEQDMPNSLRFDDEALSAFMIMAPAGGTQKITLVSPDKIGEYVFFTDIGERREGIMIVEDIEEEIGNIEYVPETIENINPIIEPTENIEE
ncbi:cupredoxin domain-containing protein [Candidatus Wolfebacteria bacterium]|nr:cupredoxin domain-containing protein [Candidatus Wolfebacteria bacterium]